MHLVYQALKAYGGSSEFIFSGKSHTSEFPRRDVTMRILFIRDSPHPSNMHVVISRQLFTVGSNASFITLDRESKNPYYRAAATREIQSHALYWKYRFPIYDTPRWLFTYDMIGFSQSSLYWFYIINRSFWVGYMQLVSFL